MMQMELQADELDEEFNDAMMQDADASSSTFSVQWRRRVVITTCSCLLLLTVLGSVESALLMALALAPSVVFFRRVFQYTLDHAFTEKENRQLFYYFVGGFTMAPLLAAVAEALLIVLWIPVCFFSQRDALFDQFHGHVTKHSAAMASRSDGNRSTNGTSLLQLNFTKDGSLVAKIHHAVDLGGLHASESLWGDLHTLGPSIPDDTTGHHVIHNAVTDFWQHLQVNHTVGFYVFFVVLSFCIAGLVEESVKLWVVKGKACCGCCGMCAVVCGLCGLFCSGSGCNGCHGGNGAWYRRKGLCHPTNLHHWKQIPVQYLRLMVLALTCSALGFATIENIGFTLMAWPGTTTTFRDKLATLMFRTCLSLPLHCVCGALTGVRIGMQWIMHHALSVATTPKDLETGTRRHRHANAGYRQAIQAIHQNTFLDRQFQLLWPSIVLHGAFDLQLFGWNLWVVDTTQNGSTLATLLSTLGGWVLIGLGFRFLCHQWNSVTTMSNRGRYEPLSMIADDHDHEDDDDDDDDVVAAAEKYNGARIQGIEGPVVHLQPPRSLRRPEFA